jgi:hypothetical protein
MRVIFLTLLLAGCASTWTHPTKTAEAWYQDDYECAYASKIAGAAQPDPALQSRRRTLAVEEPGLATARLGESLSEIGDQLYWRERCMRARGWRRQ